MIHKRSASFIQAVRQYLMPLLKRLFGCHVSGFEKLSPNEKYLIVGNHNVGVLIEGLAMLDSWEQRFQGSPVCYALAHRFFFSFPGVNFVMTRLGCIPASFHDAKQAFDQGNSVLVFPGGNYEAMRLYSEREVCDFNQRKGWVRIALQNQVSVVPVSIVGSHSVNPIFHRSRWLSYVLILPAIFKIKWFPISLSQIVYGLLIAGVTSLFLPLWAVLVISYFVYMFSFFAPIIPAKIRIQASDPIDFMKLDPQHRSVDELLKDPHFIQMCYDQVSNQVQKNMDLMQYQK